MEGDTTEKVTTEEMIDTSSKPEIKDIKLDTTKEETKVRIA